MDFFNSDSLLSKDLHGKRNNKSCTTNLNETIDHL